MCVLKVSNNEIINLTKINFNEILMLNNEINTNNKEKNDENNNNDLNENSDGESSDEESSDEELNSELEPDEYIFSSDEEKN